MQKYQPIVYFSSTGEKVSFFVSDAGVLSTIDAFRKSDLKSMPVTQKREMKMDIMSM